MSQYTNIQESLAIATSPRNIDKIINCMNDPHCEDTVRTIIASRRAEKKSGERTSIGVDGLESSRIRDNHGLTEELYFALSVLFGFRKCREKYPELNTLIGEIRKRKPSQRVLAFLGRIA